MNTTPETDSTPDSISNFSPEVAKWISLLMIVASMSLVTARLADAPVLRSANDRSRWCTVWSIVERGTYQIDEIRQVPGWDTIDKVRHQDHFYSSKPQLLPRLVAEIYRGLKAVTGWTLTKQTAEVTRTILFLINIVPMGIGLWMYSGLLTRYSRDAWSHLYIMACACFGVMLLPFLTVFNNHTIAASAFFMALPLAVRILVEERRSGWRYLSCGLLTSFGVCNELPAALLVVVLFFLMLQKSFRRTLYWFAPAAFIPIAAFFLTNYQATGSWKPFYAKYGTETYEYVYEGVPSYWVDPKGIDQSRDSTATYLLHCTVGHHGILSLSPIFLLTLVSWCVPPLYWHSRLKVFHLLGLGLTCVTLGFYLTKTANYNYGGVSVALRWMMWLIPFWLLSMLPLLGVFSRQIWFRILSLVLLSVSIFSAWYPSNSPWTHNWIYQWMEDAKWIDYSDPAPEFQRKHYTWIGSLPNGELNPDYWITFQAANPNGTRQKLRLSDGGPQEPGQRLILVNHIADDQPESQTGYILDTKKFAAGFPVEEFLIKRQAGEEITEQDLQFFRGMPRRMQYASSRIRYEKSALRKDAARCHVGYTYVTIKGEEGFNRRVIRDVWFSEEVPFGVLKWEDRTQDAKTKKILSRQLWQPVEAGLFLERTPESEF